LTSAEETFESKKDNDDGEWIVSHHEKSRIVRIVRTRRGQVATMGGGGGNTEL
jgi:hypothetical protein